MASLYLLYTTWRLWVRRVPVWKRGNTVSVRGKTCSSPVWWRGIKGGYRLKLYALRSEETVCVLRVGRSLNVQNLWIADGILYHVRAIRWLETRNWNKIQNVKDRFNRSMNVSYTFFFIQLKYNTEGVA